MANKVCQTGNCLDDVHARNLCLKHYQALWRAERHLDPAEREQRRKRDKRQPDPNGFWEFVKKELNLG